MHSYLRMYRKQAHLTQGDIVFLLELSDKSNVSRWEKGFRKPTIEALISYHLIFDIPIDALLESQRLSLKEAVAERVSIRIEELKMEEADPRLNARLEFLENVHARLTADSASSV